MEEITGSAEDDELEALAATETAVGGDVTDTGQLERLGELEQWEGQDWPWQPGGRQHAGDSSPSWQDHGDEVGEEEEGDLDWEVKRGRKMHNEFGT